DAVAEQITDQVAEVLFVALLGLQRAPRRNVTDEHPAAPRVGLAGRVGDDLAQQLIDPARPEPVRLLLGGLYPLVPAVVRGRSNQASMSRAENSNRLRNSDFWVIGPCHTNSSSL